MVGLFRSVRGTWEGIHLCVPLLAFNPGHDHMHSVPAIFRKDNKKGLVHRPSVSFHRPSLSFHRPSLSSHYSAFLIIPLLFIGQHIIPPYHSTVVIISSRPEGISEGGRGNYYKNGNNWIKFENCRGYLYFAGQGVRHLPGYRRHVWWGWFRRCRISGAFG